MATLTLVVCSSVFAGLCVYEAVANKLNLVSREFQLRKQQTKDYGKYFEKLIPDKETREKIGKILMAERSSVYRVIRLLIMGLSPVGAIASLSCIADSYLYKLPKLFSKIGDGLATIG